MQSQQQPQPQPQPQSQSLPSSLQLSESQLKLMSLCQQFCNNTSNPNAQLQNKLKQYSWQDMYTLISHPHVDNNVRVVCCSVAKWLIYHKKFAHDPMLIFQQLTQFYLLPQPSLSASQSLCQLILQSIPTCYLTECDKYQLLTHLLQQLPKHLTLIPKLIKIITILVQSIQVQKINNQVIVGELLLFVENVLQMEGIGVDHKLAACQACIGCVRAIVDIVNQDDLVEGNVVEEFLTNSTLAKKLLQAIIMDSSNNVQIISTNPQLNKLKLCSLQLYSSIYIYSLQQPLFKLCISSLLNHPEHPHDQQSQILQQILKMLQRSICQQPYYPYLHKNCQPILISLLSLLKPTQSLIQLAINAPQEYVDVLYDFCMEQQRESMEVRVGSLVSSLCLYVDGYLSFLGSLAIMVFKSYNGTINAIPGSKQYMDIINTMWTDSEQHKLATCVLILCSISDQLQKRHDLQSPLKSQLKSSTHLFSPSCPLPPYLLCRLMFLYSFQGYPGCLDPFLPYKSHLPVYQLQLQSCYKIMSRYYNRFAQCKQYLDSICPVVIVGQNLTPLLETMILTGEINVQVQYRIMEKLVMWMEDGVRDGNCVKCNKIGNLMAVLVQRLAVVDYKQSQDIIYAYLQPLLKSLLTQEPYTKMQQFLLQPIPGFIHKFPCLSSSPSKLTFILQLCYKIIQRNNGILNNCLDIMFQITYRCDVQLLRHVIEMFTGCLLKSQQESDCWQCYYGIQCCVVRGWEMGVLVGVGEWMGKIRRTVGEYQCEVLNVKALMVLMSIYATNLSIQTINYSVQIPILPQHIFSRNVPPYESKPYLIYLLTICPHMKQTPQQSYKLLKLILTLLIRQKNIAKQIKKYEQQLYEGMENSSETAIDAYNITRKLVHPLIVKGVDVYNQFRKCWNGYRNKQGVVSMMGEDEKNAVKEMAGQVVINHKTRKIYKVKQDSSGNNSVSANNQVQNGGQGSQMQIS